MAAEAEQGRRSDKERGAKSDKNERQKPNPRTRRGGNDLESHYIKATRPVRPFHYVNLAPGPPWYFYASLLHSNSTGAQIQIGHLPDSAPPYSITGGARPDPYS